MFLFKDLTAAGCMAGFLHHLAAANQGGIYASARLDEALANLVALHVARAQGDEDADSGQDRQHLSSARIGLGEPQ